MRGNQEWMGISDLMTGLMMIFLFIAIAFMIRVEQDKKAMAEIAVTYEQSQQALFQELQKEFKDDLPKWGAEILPDNTIRFKEPDVLFATSSSSLKTKFKQILSDFFPRYLNILTNQKFINEIEEVRIEGHTSSRWNKESKQKLAYIGNARLSQDRSFNVLTFVYSLDKSEKHRKWLSRVIRANGLSFAKRIYNGDGKEDFAKSRRVEFRVVTKTEDKIYEILQRSKK